jgi:hypothetical protein
VVLQRLAFTVDPAPKQCVPSSLRPPRPITRLNDFFGGGGVCCTRRLAVENVLGLTFLYASIVDCGKMVDAMKGCVGNFEECVLPILDSKEAEACGLRSDENAEYAEWARTCGPRGDPITLMVVAPSAASLGMTVVFTLMFFARTAKRIRVRAAPLMRLKWNHLSDLHLKAVLRMAGMSDEGTKKERNSHRPDR